MAVLVVGGMTVLDGARARAVESDPKVIALEISGGNRAVRAGDPFALMVTSLSVATQSAYPDVTFLLQSRPPGTSTWFSDEIGYTSQSGRAELHLMTREHAEYRVVAAATERHAGAASAVVAVTTTGAVWLQSLGDRVERGSQQRLIARAPRSSIGEKATLWRLSSGVCRKVDSHRLRPEPMSAQYSFKVGTKKKGTFRYRATIGATAGTAAGTSATVTYQVR